MLHLRCSLRGTCMVLMLWPAASTIIERQSGGLCHLRRISMALPHCSSPACSLGASADAVCLRQITTATTAVRTIRAEAASIFERPHGPLCGP